MAKNDGPHNFTGSIGDRTYYNLKGVGPLVRKKRGPSKEEMDANPNFETTKQNNKEFGAAATVAKAIRMGLGQPSKEFQDSTFSGRLAGIIRTVIQYGEGEKGQRQCNLHMAPGRITGFPLSVANSLKRTYTAPYHCTINDQRTAITIHIPETKNYHHTSKPKYATYFKLTAALSLVSHYNYKEQSNTYLPVIPQQNAKGYHTETQAFELDKTYTNNEITLLIPDQKPLDSKVAATIWLGITYHTKNYSDFEDLQAQKAMECIAIL
ncbi:hypothetical protein NA63_1769 [Flavobacteriaceae bacterium MAR_2010_105]|nr:hypothetical protein NA63_1769 [Flavobacteriaceae bacterium MAR_2010_105]